MATISLGEFTKKLEKACVEYTAKEREYLIQVSEVAKHKAKSKIGHLQDAWAPLAQATIDDKVAKGYDFNGDHNPLLRTGELRDEIENGVVGRTALVGVAEGSPMADIAVYQELGTPGSKHPIPPRSFLGSAMNETEEMAIAGAKEFLLNLLTGKTGSLKSLNVQIETYKP